MSQGDIDRGARAEKLLRDPDLLDAFGNVRTAIFERIEQWPIHDKDGLMQLRVMLKLLSDVRANLEQAIRDGKFAADQLQWEERRKLSPAEFMRAYRR